MSDYNELHARRQKALADANAILEEGRKADKTLTDLQSNRFNQLIAEADMCERQMADAIDGEDIDTTRRPGGADVTVRGDGRAVRGDLIELPAVGLRSGQRFVDHVREQHGPSEYEGLALGSYLRSMVVGAKTDLEKRALSEGSDSSGGYSVPTILSAQLIDMLRRQTVVFRAGARTVPLSSDVNHVARIESYPKPAWRSEAGTVAEDDATFSRITFEPRSLAVLVRASRELLDDSLNVRTALPNILTQALALELDRVCLLGSGSSPEPQGIKNFASLTSNSFAGGALSNYSPLVQARGDLRLANVGGPYAAVMSPREETALGDLQDTTNQPLRRPGALDDVSFFATTAMPTDEGSSSPPDESSLIVGDFSRLLVGIRNNLEITVLRERYADTWQMGFICTLRADVAAEHEAAFTVLTGIT